MDVRKNGHLWGALYDRDSAEILKVPDEIVKAMSERLRPGLTRRQESQLLKRDTDSAESYKLYLHGRDAWNKRTAPDIQKAIGLFSKAIELDPETLLRSQGLVTLIWRCFSTEYCLPRRTVQWQEPQPRNRLRMTTR